MVSGGKVIIHQSQRWVIVCNMKAIILIAVTAFLVVFFMWVNYEEYLHKKRETQKEQARNRRLFHKIEFEEQHKL